MDSICLHEKCTGCGLCVNICKFSAIQMIKDNHGFVYPHIDQSHCKDCGICKKICPANNERSKKENIKYVYSAWNKNYAIKKSSTSGGIFYELSKSIIEEGGIVAGVAWNSDFFPQHIVIDNISDISLLQGSKYSQSNTGMIYKTIKENLITGRKVLFSGTPCQVAALKKHIGRWAENLYCIDLVCHGVPSNEMLGKHYTELKGTVKSVNLRKKDPYWDYSFVSIDFEKGERYKALTIDDPYFNLFNIGYSLRPSCHECKYTNTSREGDITLADFWGYQAHNIHTIQYNKGTSLVLVNSNKGIELFDKIKKHLYFEGATIEAAKKSNKSLSEPFRIEKTKLESFWKDYENGASVKELNQKYCANTFTMPKYILLRRIYNKWKWIIKR